MSNQKREEISFRCSERIKSLIGKGESVSAFARRLGLKQAAVDRYVKAKHVPNGEALIVIANQCGVTSDWLLGLSDAKYPTQDGVSNSEMRRRALEAEQKLSRVSEMLDMLSSVTAKLKDTLK